MGTGSCCKWAISKSELVLSPTCSNYPFPPSPSFPPGSHALPCAQYHELPVLRHCRMQTLLHSLLLLRCIHTFPTPTAIPPPLGRTASPSLPKMSGLLAGVSTQFIQCGGYRSAVRVSTCNYPPPRQCLHRVILHCLRTQHHPPLLTCPGLLHPLVSVPYPPVLVQAVRSQAQGSHQLLSCCSKGGCCS
jgi:hypothetical protein